MISKSLLLTLLVVEMIGFTSCFTAHPRLLRQDRFLLSTTRQRRQHSANNGKISDPPVLSTHSYLSHAMICVPNVNATVSYWVENKGATLYTYRKTHTTESAFVGFGGRDAMDPDRFALEITKSKAKEFNLGNALSYIGISMLLKYDFTSRKDVKKLMEENKPEPPLFVQTTRKKPRPSSTAAKSGMVETDPSGIEVRYVASAPGDPLARICFQCAGSLENTSDFYQKLLGMEEVALDEENLCLRFSSGETTESRLLPTTLVFSKQEVDGGEGLLEYGNCFDHLVIGTKDVALLEERIRSSVENSAEADEVIFMTPRQMFGSTVMGLLDPNGYKIFVMERTRGE